MMMKMMMMMMMMMMINESLYLISTNQYYKVLLSKGS